MLDCNFWIYEQTHAYTDAVTAMLLSQSPSYFYLAFALDHRYEEKRWIPRDGNARSDSEVHEQTETVRQPNPEQRSGHAYLNNSRSSYERRKGVHASATKESISAVRTSVPLSHEGPEQVLTLLYGKCQIMVVRRYWLLT